MLKNFFSVKRIYLDYASVCPVDKEVISEISKIEKEFFANPSGLHQESRLAKKILREARNKIARSLKSKENDIIFTSGGTEANNIFIQGILKSALKDKKPEDVHVITSPYEHPSVYAILDYYKELGIKVSYIPVNEEGIIDPSDVLNLIKPETVLITCMYVNNEIGSIQPIREIALGVKSYKEKNKIVQENYPYFHTDACQAPLYLNCLTNYLLVDAMTFDGSKFYGPHGAGFLYKKSHIDKLEPIYFGGGQEQKIRSGTEPVALWYGLALAFEKITTNFKEEAKNISEIRDYFFKKIEKEIPEIKINGSLNNRVANNINICIPKLNAEYAVIQLDNYGISCSSMTACKMTDSDSRSKVIEAIGKKDCSASSLRFSLGRHSQKQDIDELIKALKQVIVDQKI